MSTHIIIHFQNAEDNELAYISFTIRPCIPPPPGSPLPSTIQPSPLPTHLPPNRSQTRSLLCFKPSVLSEKNKNIKKTGELDFKTTSKVGWLSWALTFLNEWIKDSALQTATKIELFFFLPLSSRLVFFSLSVRLQSSMHSFNADCWSYQDCMNGSWMRSLMEEVITKFQKSSWEVGEASKILSTLHGAMVRKRRQRGTWNHSIRLG